MGLTVVVDQRYNGQAVKNVLRYGGNDAILAFGQEITDAIAQNYIDTVQNRMSSEWSFDSCTFYDTAGVPGTPGQIVIPTQGAVQGTGIEAGLANTTAMLVSYIANGGPPFRGRQYIAGLTQNQLVVGGLWGVGTIAEFTTWATELQTLSGSGLVDIFQEIESTKSNQVPAGTRAAVTGLVVRANPATQRRRRIGVGA